MELFGKKRNRAVAGVLAFLLAVSAAACGTKADDINDSEETGTEVAVAADATEEPNAETESEPEGTDVEEPKSNDAVEYDTEGTVGKSYVKFVGAETAEGFTYTKSDGSTMTRRKIWFYYDFTNLADGISSAAGALDMTITQDGKECERVYTQGADSVTGEETVYPDETGNDLIAVAPGVSIRCVTDGHCWYNPEGGDITITLTDSESGSSVSYTVSPNDIPAPTNWSAEIYEDAQWIKEEVREGKSDKDQVSLSITDYEVIEADDGSPAIRFYIEFTNEGESEASFDSKTEILMLQDGVGFKNLSYAASMMMGLDDDVPAEEVEEDSVESAGPGETVTITIVEKLRTASPVEFVIYGSYDGEVICSCIADVKDGYDATITGTAK